MENVFNIQVKIVNISMIINVIIQKMDIIIQFKKQKMENNVQMLIFVLNLIQLNIHLNVQKIIIYQYITICQKLQYFYSEVAGV